MIITIPSNKALEFERGMLSNPMIEVLGVTVYDTEVKYQLECPDFFHQIPTYAVAE